MDTVRNLDQAFVQNQPNVDFHTQRLFETFQSEIYFPVSETGKTVGGSLNWSLTFSVLNEIPFQNPATPAAVQPTTFIDSLFLSHFDANHKKRAEITLPGINLLPVIAYAPKHKIPGHSIHHTQNPIKE